MKSVKLQVPMGQDVRDAATRRANEDGLTSLQEVVRVLLKKYATGELNIGVYSVPEESLEDYENVDEILAGLAEARQQRAKTK